MPIYTKNYNLTAFTWGDIYSSFEDRNRFTIIDNQMDFISDRIGNGLINGWDIINNGDGTISISDGIGLINKNVVYSFGGYSLILDDDSIHNLYIKRRDVIGGVSGNSNISSVLAVNTDLPSSPYNEEQVYDLIGYLSSLDSYDNNFMLYLKNMLNVTSIEDNIILINYSQIAFKWEYNEDPDFSHFVVKRSDTSSGFEEIFTTVEKIYIDINLDSNTEYFYQVISVDVSGNESEPLEFSFSTGEDDRVPLSPLNLQVFPGKKSIQIVWDDSPSDNVVFYKVVLKHNDIVIDEQDIYQTDYVFNYCIFKNLNNLIYDIYVYSISQYMIDHSDYSNASYSFSTANITYTNKFGEISDFYISFKNSEIENVGIESDLFWNYTVDDSSNTIPSMFVLIIIDETGRYSEPIELSELIYKNNNINSENPYQYEYNLKYIPYSRDDGSIFYEVIKEFSSYTFIMQSVDEDDNKSYGIFNKVKKTPVSKSVSSVSNFSLKRNNNNSLFIQWDNPVESYFSYNLITIKVVNLSEPSSFFYESENKSIGKSNSYLISSEFFDVNYRYEITLKSYDSFDTYGDEYTYIKLFEINEDEYILPDEVNSISITNGDTILGLFWSYDLVKNNEVVSFNIYRGIYSFYMTASDFSLIATISSSYNKFVDYNVSNGQTYTYFISAVDVYGNESFEISDESPFPSYSVSGTPSVMSSFDSPSNLSCSLDGMDVLLSWDSSPGTFDGYQILRSFDNSYSFQVVGYCSSFEDEFRDVNAALVNNKRYYYTIRKFVNEVDLEVSNEIVYDDNYLFIGCVETSFGTSVVSIDTGDVRNIENLEDPIIEAVDEKIKVHNHRFERGIDKRIELRSNVVINDWETSDYINYYTDQDLTNLDTYVLRISGDINEDYFKDNLGNIDFANLQLAVLGSSPVVFDVDKENGKITFNSALYSVCVPSESLGINCPICPYSSEPTIILELLNISEVDNYIDSERIEEISASQITSGRLLSEQISLISHEGRIGEELSPLKLDMDSLDNVVYVLNSTYDSDRNKLGESVSFYDVISPSNNDYLISATSQGIWGSPDFGNSWEFLANFSDVAPFKFYQDSSNKIYAITNYGVYSNSDLYFRSWYKIDGMDNVKIVRDISEDDQGNLYASTDAGLFKYNKQSVPYIEDKWQKIYIYGLRSSDFYSVLFDSGILYASNDIGLLESSDYGESWSYSSDLTIDNRIWHFKKEDIYLYALSDNVLYRKEDGQNFTKIYTFDDNVICRKIEIFNNSMFVSTNQGVYVSSSFDSLSVSFSKTLSNLSVNDCVIAANCLKNIDNLLVIGTDRRLLLMDENFYSWTQYDQKITTIPTFYINGQETKIGFYYNNSSSSSIHTLSFDKKLGVNDVVTVSNKYDIYYSENGGWVNNKYNAKVFVYKNYYNFAESRSNIDIDKTKFMDIIFPEYNDLNSHKIKADEYKEILQSKIDEFVQYSGNDDNFKVNIIREIYKYFDLFLSQLYKEARIITNEDGTISKFVIPTIVTDLVNITSVLNDDGEYQNEETPVFKSIGGGNYEANMDVVNGQFVFDIPFDKYDKITVDIKNVFIDDIGENTHREIEDKFEDIYSGFTSYLSQVQQINLIKMGLFNEKMWPDFHDNYSNLINTKYIIPRDYSSFDDFNSTFNYILQESIESDSFSIDCPSSVKYISNKNKIYVGGWEGVLSIDVNSLDILKLDIDGVDGQMVRDIFYFNNSIYIVFDRDIYVSNDGETWTEYSTSGLPNNLYSIGAISNNILVGAIDGIYIKNPNLDADWEKVISSNSPVSVMLSSNVLFAVINNRIHISSNGYSYRDTGLGEDIGITGMDRDGYLNLYISSISGFYSDGGSFNGTQNKIVEIDMGDLFDGDNTINDVSVGEDVIAIAISDGSYGVIENDVLRTKEYSSLPSVHKILVIDNEIWLFGGSLLKAPDVDYPIKLVTGIVL